MLAYAQHKNIWFSITFFMFIVVAFHFHTGDNESEIMYFIFE